MITATQVSKDYATHDGHRRVLSGISFVVHRSEKLAILGRNGAGKSTLIRLLAGIEAPTSGTITRASDVSWPIGLGGGFHGSLTGHDNMRFIARVYGRPFEEIRDFVDDFAELGRYLHMPVKTYSSGMRARLAFALSLAIEFDCYLIDEVILVGDRRFHERCRVELFEKRCDRVLILASHDAATIRRYCGRALVLHNGRGKVFDDVELAIDISNAL